jgi:phosphatidate cytidylyltransferase
VSNFFKRALTGAVFVVVMLGGIYYSYWSLAVLFFIIAMLGLHEFYSLLKFAKYEPQREVGMFVGAVIFLLFIFRYELFGEMIFTLMVPFIMAIFFAELYRNVPNPFTNIALTLTGIIYIVLPFALWVNYACPYAPVYNKFMDQLIGSFSSTSKYNPQILIGYFLILWTNDTGAYLSGMALGKHKLWERISPKKTWEGFWGGVILSIVVAFFISKIFTGMSPLLWMIIGLLVSVFGTLGDLVESLFKRSIDVKESGGILPGHGGILDRFDGVLLSTPIVLTFVQIAEFISNVVNG